MPRDYAQGRNRRRSGIPGWVWMILGLSLGGVGVFVWLKGPWSQPPARPAASAPPPADTAKPKPESERRAAASITLPPKEKPRFTFYELLPSEEVVVPREEQPKAGSKSTKAKPGESRYIIQVASFRSKEEAEAQKAQLALLGIESRVERVTIDEVDTFYRVRIGPIADFGKVQIITSRLEANGLQGLVVKVK